MWQHGAIRVTDSNANHTQLLVGQTLICQHISAYAQCLEIALARLGPVHFIQQVCSKAATNIELIQLKSQAFSRMQ